MTHVTLNKKHTTGRGVLINKLFTDPNAKFHLFRYFDKVGAGGPQYQAVLTRTRFGVKTHSFSIWKDNLINVRQIGGSSSNKSVLELHEGDFADFINTLGSVYIFELPSYRSWSNKIDFEGQFEATKEEINNLIR